MTDAHLMHPPASGVPPSPAAPNRTLTVGELLDAYMAAYTGRDSSRARYVATWRDYLGAVPASALDVDRVADALDVLARTPAQRYVGRDRATGAPRYLTLGIRAPATLNRYKSALSAALTWAKRRRLLPRAWNNPCREIPAERENNARVRFLSQDELERLLKAARVSAWPKLYCFILLALTTGARRGELMGLHWREIDLERAIAHVVRSKNGRPRVLPLTPAVLAELRKQPAPHPDALVFCSRYRSDRVAHWKRAWDTALALARIEDFRPHDMRHSAASYLAMAGASLVEIADVLGHKQLDVTRRYAHLSTDHKHALVHRVLGGIGAPATVLDSQTN